MARSLVPILVTREAVAPLENDPIMSGRLIRSFRHLKHQNLSTGDDFIHQGSIATARSHIRGVVVPFLATREVVAPLTNDPIMSRDRYSCSGTLNIKILQNLRPVALQTGEIFF